MPIPTDAGRLLRAASDTSVERWDASYLTVLPIPELRAQAFIRTWAAEPWLRPGSVWSHVLLVDFVTLAAQHQLSGLLAAFQRPTVHDNSNSHDLVPYRLPLPIGHVFAVRGDTGPISVNSGFAIDVFAAIYGTEERSSLVVPDAAATEQLLLEIYEQQWPRLRRQFAFRTRQRASDGSQPFDLEIVERNRMADSPTSAALKSWMPPLVKDLSAPQPSDLRQFLRVFGTETKHGRTELPNLVGLYQQLVDTEPLKAVEFIAREYPRPTEMRMLKRSLFQRAHRESAWQLPPGWPADDAGKLSLLFAASGSVDYEELQVADRLGALIESTPNAAVTVLHDIDLEHLPTSVTQTLVGAITRNTDDEAVSRLALAHPDLGLLLAAQRPALLGQTAIWATLDTDLLVELFERGSVDLRTRTLVALADGGGSEPLLTLCNATPTIWWDLLLASADSATDRKTIEHRASMLRIMLPRVGAAAIGNPPRPPVTRDELVLLLLSAELSAGLWRHAGPDAWLNLTRSLGNESAAIRDRAAAVALLSASTSNREIRIRGWRLVFPLLHSLLASSRFDEEAWTVLSPALPAAPEWDRCLRLRRGAISEIRRDNWPRPEFEQLFSGAGQYRAEMQSEFQVESVKKKKKKKHWLRELAESLLP